MKPEILLPNSFEETEWLIPPTNKTACDKARHAYNQWKQEPLSLSTHTCTTPAWASGAVSQQGGSAASNSVLTTSASIEGAGATVEAKADDGGWTIILS